jgi:hypothetical protein
MVGGEGEKMSWFSFQGRAAIVLMGLLVLGIRAEAGVIVWNGAQTTAGDSDVSTAGTLVGALNLGEPGAVVNTTVNGVTFDAAPVNGPTYNSGHFHFAGPFGGFTTFEYSGQPAPYSGLSSAYRTLLNDGGSVVGFLKFYID